MSEVVSRFATTSERSALLRGLLSYRDRLRSIGVLHGLQWIDGSFAEDIERVRGRAPADIDVVTVSPRPEPDLTKWRALVVANLDLFDPARTKLAFGCDAYFIDSNKPPTLAIADSIYFFGLFSHQRATGVWKGMIAVPLRSDDQVAQSML